MDTLVNEANLPLERGGFDYAFCGGFALDLWLGKPTRTHSDMDICAIYPYTCGLKKRLAWTHPTRPT